MVWWLVDVANYLKAHPEEIEPLSSYRFIVFGGSPTPTETTSFLERKLGTPLIELYGQTETTGLCITYRTGEKTRPGFMGRAMEQVIQAKVITPGGEHVILPGMDETGILYVKGDTVTPGYWKREDLNEKRLKDGWLQTGDLVQWDKNRYFRYVDRLDDMIISGGENVYPKEVENVLSQHPKVLEVAVIGTHHPRWIQQVTAVIVPGEEGVTAEEIQCFCHDRLPGYKCPKRIELLEVLPRTGSGKVDKRRLKEMFKER